MGVSGGLFMGVEGTVRGHRAGGGGLFMGMRGVMFIGMEGTVHGRVVGTAHGHGGTSTGDVASCGSYFGIQK